jgi:hypothetical protein
LLLILGREIVFPKFPAGPIQDLLRLPLWLEKLTGPLLINPLAEDALGWIYVADSPTSVSAAT